MKKKVLFLANHFITLYSFRKELINKLVQEGHEVFLSLPEDKDNEYFEKFGCKIIITDIDRRGVNPVKDLKLLSFYKRIMNDIKPDIIFSYTIKPNIYGTLASNNKYKQVCNITGTGATFLKDNLVSKIVKVLYRLSITKCYKVFFQNTGDRDFFINNGLVKNNYDMLPGSGCNVIEHKYSDMPSGETIRFMYVGRVMEVKGVDEYLQAAKNVKEKYPNTEFIIAGWNEEDKYINIVKDYQDKGYVNYIGFRKDINDWLEKVNCVVLASHGGEGVPNVLLEASATGRAIIGSNINGITDVIKDGYNGYLFEKCNAKSLEEKLIKYINLTYEDKLAMGKNARKYVEDNFDRKIVINKYIQEVENS